MSQEFVISQFSFEEDCEAVLDLWRSAGDGIQLRDSDRPEEIRKKTLRDPDLFLIARIDEKMAGTVMGGFDGRRGSLYHLAVAEPYRHRGIARQLVAEVERRLKVKGCLKINLMVTPGNHSAMAFYQKLGYEVMSVVPFGKQL